MTLRGAFLVASSLHLIVNPARAGYDAFRIVATEQLCYVFYRSGLGDMVRLPKVTRLRCTPAPKPVYQCWAALISWAQARLTHKLFPRSLPRSLTAASVGRNPRSISVSSCYLAHFLKPVLSVARCCATVVVSNGGFHFHCCYIIQDVVSVVYMNLDVGHSYWTAQEPITRLAGRMPTGHQPGHGMVEAVVITGKEGGVGSSSSSKG